VKAPAAPADDSATPISAATARIRFIMVVGANG
jgi:hypothetical protein